MSTKRKPFSSERLSHENYSNVEEIQHISNDETMTDHSNNKEKCVRIFEPFLGTLYVLINSIMVQSISIIVMRISYISICQLSLIRYAGIFSAAFPLAIFCTEDVIGEPKDRRLLFAKGFLGATGLVFQITAYRYIQLVQASIIMSTLPFTTAILARILLKEPFGVIQTISLLITTCGLLISMGLPKMIFNKNFHFQHDHLIGYASAFGFVLCIALSTVAIRKLRKTHFSVIILYTSFAGIIENAIFNATIFPLVPANCGWDVTMCILLGVFGFLSILFFTLAVQKVHAGLISIQKSSFDILVSMVFQIIFFFQYPDWYSATGAFLVIVSLIILGIRNWLVTQPEESKISKRFKFLFS